MLSAHPNEFYLRVQPVTTPQIKVGGVSCKPQGPLRPLPVSSLPPHPQRAATILTSIILD